MGKGQNDALCFSKYGLVRGECCSINLGCIFFSEGVTRLRFSCALFSLAEVTKSSVHRMIIRNYWLLSAILSLPVVSTNVIWMDMDNHDGIIKSAQVVFVAFCADWCPFSRRLKPIFEEAAAAFAQENPTANVVWALVDSVEQAKIADKYYVSKYPTMKVFINGELANKEYRSTRSVEALTAFVKQQLSSSIRDFSDSKDLEQQMDKSKRNVIAYFVNKDTDEYRSFQKAATVLREDCSFWVGINKNLETAGGSVMHFRDPDTEDEQKFTGSFTDYKYLKQWLTDKCIPLVREVTFENVEELTEEGLPFLLLFRNPGDKEGDKKFTELVMRELYDQKNAINALLADGYKFAHPLKHLGKTEDDLPVLAIDSFQHMFLFDNMNELYVPGKLRQFVLDLHSGKLHREFHKSMDQEMIDLQKLALKKLEMFAENDAKPPVAMPPPTPPPSVFKELKPSENRYSLLRKTEL
uniref:Thioredoxin domain-containing protein n=1 Tax=Setaria digitata TaxID=48799 RepID=A0A915PHN3_9BILA